VPPIALLVTPIWRTRCEPGARASEADDVSAKLVYCSGAGQEISVCVREASGSEYYKDLALKVYMFSDADSAAMTMGDREKLSLITKS
jgi:hypothetical protein